MSFDPEFWREKKKKKKKESRKHLKKFKFYILSNKSYYVLK